MKSNYITPMVLQSIDTAGIADGAYSVLDADGVDGPLSSIRFFNNSDTDVFVSIDGTNDHWVVPADYEYSDNFQSNSQREGVLKKGTKIYVRGTAGTGYFYVSGYYQE